MYKNPSALITGAARRIGAMIANYLHARGMNIVLHYHQSEEEAKALCDQFNQTRENSASIVKADLSQQDSEKFLIEAAVNVWGRLDVLVNNASRFYRTPRGEATNEAWDDLMTSNLKSPFFLSQHAAPHLKKTKGNIINITDIHAERPMKDYSVYCIAKSGLLMQTKVLAKEFAPEIRVNAVAPGAIIWPEGENVLTNDEKQHIIGNTLLKRSGCAEDIAKAVTFLALDAEYVTGQVINVDGGRILCK